MKGSQKSARTKVANSSDPADEDSEDYEAHGLLPISVGCIHNTDLSDEDGDDDLNDIAAPAKKQEKKYAFEQNVHANAFIRYCSHSAGWERSDSLSVCSSFFLLISVVLLQQIATYCILRSSLKEVNSVLQHYELLLMESQLKPDSWYGVISRSTEDDGEDICGKFLRYGSDDEGGYFAKMNWDDILSWRLDELSRMQEALRGLYSFVPGHLNSWIFIVATLSWTICCSKELKNAGTFLTAISSAQVADVCVFESGDPPEIKLKCVTWRQKLFGCIIWLIRSWQALFLYVSGCVFLQSDLSVANLILNAVALAFILEFDTLIYTGLFSIYGLHSTFNDNLVMDYHKCVKHKSRQIATAIHAVFVFVFCVVNYIWAQAFTRTTFTATAAFCLFAGPSPNISHTFNVSFPYPGLCESLACNNTIRPPAPMTQPCNRSTVLLKSAWITGLRNICVKMMQQKTIEKYEVLEHGALQSYDLGMRMYDEDLSSIGGGMEPARNFWCPTSTVETLLQWDRNLLDQKFETGTFWGLGNSLRQLSKRFHGTDFWERGVLGSDENKTICQSNLGVIAAPEQVPRTVPPAR
jgi:hypothetical protein